MDGSQCWWASIWFHNESGKYSTTQHSQLVKCLTWISLTLRSLPKKHRLQEVDRRRFNRQSICKPRNKVSYESRWVRRLNCAEHENNDAVEIDHRSWNVSSQSDSPSDQPIPIVLQLRYTLALNSAAVAVSSLCFNAALGARDRLYTVNAVETEG